MRLFDRLFKSNQLPGPMSGDAEAGWNFNGYGEDMSGVQGPPTNPPTNQLPYSDASEDYDEGIDMRGVASPDPVPVANNFGVLSDDGQFRDDIASSAGFHMVRSFEDMYGRQYTGTTPAPYGEQDSDFTGPLR